ncbi:FHA domain-containing protein [Micromonospora sp. NPDC004336]
MHSYFELHHDEHAAMVPAVGDLLTIGRAPENELRVDSKEVSRLHAVVERYPAGWCIRDLGSTNGTEVNGVPLRQARVLRDGDRITVGPARLVFRAPAGQSGTRTVPTAPALAPPELTRREHDVIEALCRPFVVGGTPFPQAPPLRALAAELGLSESAVKKHLAHLYDKFGLRTREQRRRAWLAGEALRRGVVAAVEPRS